MRRTTLLRAAGLLTVEVAAAQYTQLPAVPATVYNVQNHSAVGDNKTLNTAAIQHALDLARANGGTVLLPAGEYLCGSLQLYSKTQLEIASGATLRPQNDIADFPVINVTRAALVNCSLKATSGEQARVYRASVEGLTPE